MSGLASGQNYTVKWGRLLNLLTGMLTPNILWSPKTIFVASLSSSEPMYRLSYQSLSTLCFRLLTPESTTWLGRRGHSPHLRCEHGVQSPVAIAMFSTALSIPLSSGYTTIALRMTAIMSVVSKYRRFLQDTISLYPTSMFLQSGWWCRVSDSDDLHVWMWARILWRYFQGHSGILLENVFHEILTKVFIWCLTQVLWQLPGIFLSCCGGLDYSRKGAGSTYRWVDIYWTDTVLWSSLSTWHPNRFQSYRSLLLRGFWVW